MSGAALDALAREADGLVAGAAYMEAPAAKPVPDQTNLDAYKRMFAHSREHTYEARKLAQVDFDYYDDKQWTSEEIQVLQKRKQPQIWINRIKPAVNGILGVLEQGQSDPRAFPRNSADTGSAEIATDSLRYAAERTRWQRTKLAAAKDYLIGGTGAVIVEVDDDGDPSARRIRWEEFFYDPHSREADFSDARYLGIAKWMYADVAQTALRLSTAIPVDQIPSGSTGLASVDESDEDKPQTAWADRKANRLLVCELYHLAGGEWQRCVFHGAEVLEAGPSPYQDERGRPQCPIVAQSCYVNRDNQRYGVVRSMVPIQDEINMRRSKLLHLVNTRQLRVLPDSAPEQSVTVARSEAARPDGVIPQGYDIVPTADLAAGQANLLAESKAEIERMGPNPAVLGRQGESQSGRAQLVRQQAGLIELTPALGGIEDLELRVYRQMWCRIRQFWTEPKMIRVTDDIGAPKFLQVNEQVPTGQVQVVAGTDGMPQIQPVMATKNRPAEMDMDIIIDSAPDTANLAQEQFNELVKLAGVYGPQEVPFDDLLEASALPKKRQLIEKRQARMQEMQAAQQQGQRPNPMQEAAFRAELENKDADTQAKRAKALKDEVEAQTKVEDAMMQRLVTFGPPPPMGPQGF